MDRVEIGFCPKSADCPLSSVSRDSSIAHYRQVLDFASQKTPFHGIGLRGFPVRSRIPDQQ